MNVYDRKDCLELIIKRSLVDNQRQRKVVTGVILLLGVHLQQAKPGWPPVYRNSRCDFYAHRSYMPMVMMQSCHMGLTADKSLPLDK